jgi:hypothetical protein
MKNTATKIARALIKLLKSKKIDSITNSGITQMIDRSGKPYSDELRDDVIRVLNRDKALFKVSELDTRQRAVDKYILVTTRHKWTTEEVSKVRANIDITAKKIKEALFKDQDDVTVKAIQRKKDQIKTSIDNAAAITQTMENKRYFEDPNTEIIDTDNIELVIDLARVRNMLSNWITDREISRSIKPFDEFKMWEMMPKLNDAVKKTIHVLGEQTWWLFSIQDKSKITGKEEFSEACSNDVVYVARMANAIEAKLNSVYKKPVYRGMTDSIEQQNFVDSFLLLKMLESKDAFEKALEVPVLDQPGCMPCIMDMDVEDFLFSAHHYCNEHAGMINMKYLKDLLVPTKNKLFPGERDWFMLQTLNQLLKKEGHK